MTKLAFCISENKGADLLCGKHALKKRLCFHYIDYSYTISLLPKSEFSRL